MSSDDETVENNEGAGLNICSLFAGIGEAGGTVRKFLIRMHEFVHRLLNEIYQQILQSADDGVTTLKDVVGFCFGICYSEFWFLQVITQTKHLAASFMTHSHEDMAVNLFRTQDRSSDDSSNGDIANNLDFVVA